MSTMKKRIPMFLLALAMMVAMALPTFAASYRPNAQFGYLLNINGSTGSAYQGRALNLIPALDVVGDAFEKGSIFLPQPLEHNVALHHRQHGAFFIVQLPWNL